MANPSQHANRTPENMTPTKKPVPKAYRGRIAPTPSGWLHMGHAATFGLAWARARAQKGTLVYRTEDLDPARCRPEYDEGALVDLRWWGLDWDEGPDIGGPLAPYRQSQRMELFRDIFIKLRATGCVYPCLISRKEIRAAGPAPSPVNGDPVFPTALRPTVPNNAHAGEEVNWRFRVPDGETISFTDERLGEKTYLAGRDFGDFLVWRRDGMPAYELAVVVDDHAMKISEVVRGEDLLISTARQLLIYRALGWAPPAWYHCPLILDPETGYRLSKTNKSMALRALREKGWIPGKVSGGYPADQES